MKSKSLNYSGRVTTENYRQRELKDFEILEKLGEGSYGQVFKVRDRISLSICVLKIVPF